MFIVHERAINASSMFRGWVSLSAPTQYNTCKIFFVLSKLYEIVS